MRKILTSKKLAAVAVAAVAVTGTGVAYAYWTTVGGGSGSATTGTTEAGEAIQISQAGALTELYPGMTSVPVLATAYNPAAFSQKVGEVSVSVQDVMWDHDANATTPEVVKCAASNFAITPVDDTVGVVAALATSDADSSTSGPQGHEVARIAMVESGSNQDSCKSVTPVLVFSSAAGE